MESTVNKLKPYIAYFNICILWGASNVVAKIGLSNMNTSVFACLRYVITGLILLVISIVFKHSFPKTRSDWKASINVSLLMIFLTVGFVALGNKYTDSSMVSMILCTVPIFTAVIECFILKNSKLGLKGIIGLLGGFFGILIIVFNDTASINTDFLGISCAFLGAVSWSAGSVYSNTKSIGGSIIAQTAAQGLFAAALFFIAGKLTGDFVIPHITVKSMLPLLYLSIFDSLIGFISYIYLLKIWKPSMVATYAYINPVVALILGAFVLNESITIVKVIGMLLIIVSVILIQKDKVNKVIKPKVTAVKAN